VAELLVAILGFVVQGLALLGQTILAILCHFVAPRVSEIRSTLASILATFASIGALIAVPLTMRHFGVLGPVHWAVSFAVATPVITVTIQQLMRIPWNAAWIIASLFHLCFAFAAFLIMLAF
jgi:hypothetical protein